jgi:hypothetical protein
MQSWVTAAAFLVLLVPEACSSDSSDDDAGKGGSTAQGGAKASGGRIGQSTGGSAGTGTSSAGNDNSSAGTDNTPQGGAEHGEGGATPVTNSGGQKSAGGSNGSGGHATSSGGTSNGGESGSDAGAGGLDCSAGNGRALASEAGTEGGSGWIDGGKNCLGIQGAVYIVKDMGGSSMYFTSVINHVCVSGVAKAAVDSDHWGAQIDFQLSNNGTAGIYDATAHGFKGMEFTISGNTVPAQLMTQYRVDGQATQYCKQMSGPGDQTALLSDAHASCWNSTTSATPNATILTHFEIVVPSASTSDVPFDFCVEGLAALE